MNWFRLAFLSLLVVAVPDQASAATPAIKLTAADRAEIIGNAATLLDKRYVDPVAGKRLAQDLRNAAARWRSAEDPKAFAASVSSWLRAKSGDGHIGLSFSKTAIATATADTFSQSEMERYYGPQVNHGVERIERLANNIMFLDLRVFPPPAMAGDVFAAAMTIVAQGDALIIDLRKNGGGAETVNLVTGYLLDEGGKPLSGTYDRPSGEARPNVSPYWVPGRRFGGTKPLYILTSRQTFSAAEALAYDLQALRRATIVGEVTGGGAHPYEYRRVHPHFALELPEGRSINPITGGNWQGKGVQPDVAVAADQALDRALQLANDAIRGRAAKPGSD